ncbi:hypothetical protein ACFL5X_02855 [Candidatus Omnitrophota bacterium]
MKSEARKYILIWGPLSAAGVARLAHEGSCVLVPESRPSLLGLKHNLPLLKAKGIDCVYCPDNALGSLFYAGRIATTLLFCRGSASGDMQGVCGSLYAGLLSRLHGVAVEVLEEGSCDRGVLDRDASTLEGRNFILEEDPGKYIIRQDYESIKEEFLK